MQNEKIVEMEKLFLNKSYSQEGEDLVLSRLFESKEGGFYVDVGAHHPMRFSNTYLFYKKGWRGINIDPLIGIGQDDFRLVRPLDINIARGVASEAGFLTYYMFNEPALNTFSETRWQFLLANTPYKHIQSQKIETNKLSELLAEFLPPQQPIDFLTVDVEDLDIEVLLSNNWSLFRPNVVLFESREKNMQALLGSKIHRYMGNQGYTFFAKTVNTVFYRIPPL